MMERISKAVNWENIEALLKEYYHIGQSYEGADAYFPLMLLKCMLLQKPFHIPSGPELENQINDRISFKKFLGLSLDKPSPDHSTFSRFRSRLPEETMIQLNNEILPQSAHKGLSINEEITIDARLVKSARRPMSNEDIKKLKNKRATPEGKVDKNVEPLKFSRDRESDWTIKNGEPHYGLKEHASVDVDTGSILATSISPASVHDSNYLPYCTLASCRTHNPIKKVYADKDYHGRSNRSFLSLNRINDGIMREDTTTAKLTDYESERNKALAKRRNMVEQYFGVSHLYDEAYRARFTTILKNIRDTMCRQIPFNLFRGSKIILAT
jgi:IS5 family transposase